MGFSSGAPGNSTYSFIDASGVSWTMYWSGGHVVFVDTNGFKVPNQWGKDRFAFLINDKNSKTENNTDIPIKVIPFADNHPGICTDNKCETEENYFGTSWLINQN